jgi:PAS domain S-box-containing protein
MMNLLRVLHLEDDPDYSVLVRSMLEAEGIKADIVWVSSRSDFEAALALEAFDLILADYSLADYSGLQALQCARTQCPDVPFLLISGTIDEAAAVETLKTGATDYVLKHFPERLVPAIRRAAQETNERQQRRRAETELVRREKYFRALSENSLDILSILDSGGLFLYNSPSIKRVLGYEPHTLVKQSVFSFVHSDDLPAVQQAFNSSLKNSDQTVRLDFRFRHRDGTWLYLEAVGQSRLADPDIAGVVVNVRDVSDRKRIERRDAALAKLGQHLSSTKSPGEAARIIHEIVDDLFQWNSFTLELFDSDELLHPILIVDTNSEGRRFDAELPAQGHTLSTLVKRVVQHGAELILNSQPEGAKAKPGMPESVSRGAVSQMIAPIRNCTRVIGVLAVHSFAFKAYTQQDLMTLQTLADHCGGALERIRAEDALQKSEAAQKRLEDQLRQSQKMEAIGQLAGGVAHDFNNILTVIQGHASLLMAGGNLAGAGARSAQQISQAAERAAGLTRQLLTFSRRQVMQPRRLDMNEVVCNMNQMLGRILGEDIALQLNYSPEPAVVQADASMMEQVLLNLAVNSRDAMPKGGRLNIKISLESVQAERLSELSHPFNSTFVCLSVMDTGCGIPRENLPRIFEPFFTTKAVGKGTGLGLATVYGIIKQHQGWIDVESEPSTGATFKVFIPWADGETESAGKVSVEPSLRGGTETVLVVEDEAPVRELVCNLLISQGYRVLQAESGTEAIEIWRGSKEHVDLLLTDLVMPNQMNGRELAEKLWAERPHLKVIFTSGYSVDVIGADFVLQRGINYLQKPYPPKKLAVMVRDCLDSKN